MQTVVKRQSLLSVLACKLLFWASAGELDWPIEFVQVSHLGEIFFKSLDRVERYVILYFTFNLFWCFRVGIHGKILL